MAAKRATASRVRNRLPAGGATQNTRFFTFSCKFFKICNLRTQLVEHLQHAAPRTSTWTTTTSAASTSSAATTIVTVERPLPQGSCSLTFESVVAASRRRVLLKVSVLESKECLVLKLAKVDASARREVERIKN